MHIKIVLTAFDFRLWLWRFSDIAASLSNFRTSPGCGAGTRATAILDRKRLGKLQRFNFSWMAEQNVLSGIKSLYQVGEFLAKNHSL